MNRRLAWLRHGVTFLAIAFTLALSAVYLTKTPTLALPVRFHCQFDGLESNAATKVDVVISEDGGQLLPAHRLLETSYYHVAHHWVRQIHLLIPPELLPHLREFTVTIGENEPRLFTGDELRRREMMDPGRGFKVIDVPYRNGVTSSLPWIDKGLLNWPGDVTYLRAIVQTALLPAVLILLLNFWLGQFLSPHGNLFARTVLGVDIEGLADTPVADAIGSARFWNRLGFAILAGCFVYLEVSEPYYFTQCDTINEELPMIIAGCRSYWLGEFPDYNPYLSLGTPLAGAGLAALTYPPLPLSYAIARHLLSNEFATAEVFAILHLTAGFFLMRRLARKTGMGPFTANLAALSCNLSGAALIMGRSWFNFTPIMFWLPVVFLGLLKLRQDPATWKWVLGMGLALGLPFHLGFPQIAIYIAGFFCLGVVYLAWVGGMAWKKAYVALPALVLGAGIAIPLVMQQWLLSRGTARFEVSGQGIAMGLPAMLLPYPLVSSQVPARWGNENLQLMGHVYFFGGVLALLFFYQAIGLLFFHPHAYQGRRWAGQIWMFLGLTALWLSLGDLGGLWTVLSQSPLFGTISRHPIRLVPYFVFFASLAGGLVLQRLLNQLIRRRRGEMIVAGIALALILWHVSQCRTAFHLANYRPYPPLPADLAEHFWKDGQATGRVLSWGRYSHNDSWARQLPKNLPAVYDIPSLDGQNPLLDSGPVLATLQEQVLLRPLAALNAYGVRWHLRQRPEDFTPDSPWPADLLAREDGLGHGLTFEQFTPIPIAKDDKILLSELKTAAPLAFAEQDPTKGLNLWMHGWGLDVDVSQLGEEQNVVVNFLRWPGMTAELDGLKANCNADGWNRIVVPVEPGHHRLTVSYHPPWTRSLGYGLAMGFAGLLLAWFVLRKR